MGEWVTSVDFGRYQCDSRKHHRLFRCQCPKQCNHVLCLSLYSHSVSDNAAGVCIGGRRNFAGRLPSEPEEERGGKNAGGGIKNTGLCLHKAIRKTDTLAENAAVLRIAGEGMPLEKGINLKKLKFLKKIEKRY